jgi:proteasome lid subunit RPN8/RPN11
LPIVIPPSLARQIEAEGAKAYPNECCGVMFGRDGPEQRVVERLMPVANAFDQAEQFHRFSISPKQLMEAERIASEEHRLVLGFYHSHPDHPAHPSEYDQTHAWPFYSYVIVAISGSRAGEMTSWVLNESTEQFDQQAIGRPAI